MTPFLLAIVLGVRAALGLLLPCHLARLLGSRRSSRRRL